MPLVGGSTHGPNFVKFWNPKSYMDPQSQNVQARIPPVHPTNLEHIHPRSLTARPWKIMIGWNIFLLDPSFFLGITSFQGRAVSLPEGVSSYFMNPGLFNQPRGQWWCRTFGTLARSSTGDKKLMMFGARSYFGNSEIPQKAFGKGSIYGCWTENSGTGTFSPPNGSIKK